MTRASMIMFWLSLTIIVSLGLYHTSYQTEELGQRLRALNAQIEEEQRSIHVLKAEYVYLTNPSRIEEVSRKHLSLQPTQPKQIVRLAKLKEYAPTHLEAMSSTGVKALPIASLRPRAPTHSPLPAAEEAERVNTHLVIRKTASAEPVPLGRTVMYLDRGSAQKADDEDDSESYALAASGDDQ